MKKNNLKRFLASLLAVLMLSQVTGVAPGVFAEDTRYEKPTLQSGEAVVLSNADEATVKQVLAKALIANYDKCDPSTRDNLDWQYYCKSEKYITNTKTDWVSVNGAEKVKYGSGLNIGWYTFKSLADNNNATYPVRLKNTETSVQFTKLEPKQISYELNKNVTVTIPYVDATNVDYTELERRVLAAAVKSSTPELTLDNTSITYHATTKTAGITSTAWVPLNGGKNVVNYPAVSADNTYDVKLSFKGLGAYSAQDIELSVTFTGREASTITFKENPVVKITYEEKDGNVEIKFDDLYKAIWENVVESTVPELSLDDVTIKYHATANSGSVGEQGKEWMPLEGGTAKWNGTFDLTYPAISEGDQELRFEFKGNANYTGFSKDIPVKFEGRDPAFEIIPGITQVGMKFKDATNYDYDATANAIREAVVNKLATDESINLSDVAVEYKDGLKFKTLDENADLTTGKEYTFRLSWGGSKGTALYKPFSKEVKLTLVDNRLASSVSIIDKAGITYNMNASEMENAIFNSVINWDASELPAKDTLTVKSFVIEYYATAQFEAGDAMINLPDEIAHAWVPIGGLSKTVDLSSIGLGKIGIVYPQMGAGEQQIRIRFIGSKDYKPSAAVEGTLNVAKADVKVSMKLLTSVLAGQKVNKDVLKVTLNPDDPELDLYIVFVGFNTYKEKTIYVKLTEDQEKVIDFISDTQKGFPLYYKEEQTIRGKLNEGMTVDEFITYVDELMKNDTIKSALEKNGIDAEMLQNIVTALKSINKVTGDLRIAIGSPKHAGLYQAFAVAVNKNYNTGVGTGTVIVAMNAAGMKLEPNTELKKQTITVSEAEKYKKGEKAVATLTCDGDASDIDQSCIHYRFTGLSKIYSSHDFPTAPGKYIVTVSVRGGDYYALPTTFTFTVKAD